MVLTATNTERSYNYRSKGHTGTVGRLSLLVYCVNISFFVVVVVQCREDIGVRQ